MICTVTQSALVHRDQDKIKEEMNVILKLCLFVNTFNFRLSLLAERKHLQNFVEKDLESTAGKGTTSQDGRIETIENPHCGTVTDTCGGADQSYIIQEQACKEGSEPQTSHSSETLEIKNKTASSIARTFRTVSSQELRILHTGPQTEKETAAAAAVG